MTPQEESEFKLYGCMSRCIIRASELSGSPISRDDFVAKYSGLFPEEQFGLLSLDDFCIIVKDLGLAGSVESVRRLEAVKPILANTPWRVFLLTDWTLDGRPIYHCRLALGYGHQREDRTKEAVHIFHPDQSGQDMEIWESIEDFDAKFGHFLIAYP